MKKSVIMAGAALMMLTLGACNSGNGCNGKDHCDNKCDKDAVFTGVLPAADAAGIRYTLHLDYDHDDKDGDYKLVETYLQADTTSAMGYRDLKSFSSEGDFTVEKQGEKTYLKLVKDAKDSSAGSIDTPIYLLVDSDSTLTLTNQALEVSETPGMNYTLKLAD